MYRKKRSKSESSTPPQDVTVYHDVKNDTKLLFDDSIYADATSFPKDYSKESGVEMLTRSSLSNSSFAVQVPAKTNTSSISKQQRSSSDYLTCSHSSINSLEKNIFEITDDLSDLNLNINNSACAPVEKAKSDGSEGAASDQCSFVSVSEVYKYVDEDQGVVLFERRLLKTSR